MNKLIKAALIRALYTVGEAMVSTLPVGFVITPAMIQSFDWSFLFVILAWLFTALFTGFIAFVRAMISGLPEVEEDMMEDEDFDKEGEDDDEY